MQESERIDRINNKLNEQVMILRKSLNSDIYTINAFLSSPLQLLTQAVLGNKLITFRTELMWVIEELCRMIKSKTNDLTVLQVSFEDISSCLFRVTVVCFKYLY